MLDTFRQICIQFGETDVRKHFMSAPKLSEIRAGNIGRKI
jgi:hypothetical protein